MQIVRAPELDQIRPRCLVILLRTNPLVPVVTRKDEVIRELSAHKSLMIVCRRVDQVTEDLFTTPSAVTFLARLFGRERAEPGSGIANGLFEISQKLAIGSRFSGSRKHFSHDHRILSQLLD